MEKEIMEEELQKLLDPLHKEQMKLAKVMLDAVGKAFQKGIEIGMSFNSKS